MACLVQAKASVDSVRQTDAVCANCHGEIYRKYLKTPMANASGTALDFAMTGDSEQVSSGVSYRIFLDNGSLWLNYQSSRNGGFSGRNRLDYFLGSGHLGTTYLYSINNYLLESPVAYYSRLKVFDMKPGLEHSQTMPSALPMTSECMRCHMSSVQAADKGTVNRFATLPFLHGGITCESCHGDASEHVKQAGKSPVVNPAKLDADRRDSICISCHLEGDTSVEHRGKSMADYRPGDRIGDYVSYFALSGAVFSDRGVSEVEEFNLSKCKRTSGAAMSCMTCHDPHGGPSAEERVSFYRAKCLTCHSQPKFAAQHHVETPDCTSCHMPSGKAQNIPHVAWTDHWIRRFTTSFEALNSSRGRIELVPLLGNDVSPRDQALAYYNLVADGKLSDLEGAWRALSAIQGSDASDPSVLVARGHVAQMRGDHSGAIDLYRATLVQDPSNLLANNNLGTLLAESGQFSAAATQWKNAYELNYDIAPLGINLALVDCKLGRKSEAQQVLGRVLTYSPGSEVARRKLAAMESGEEHCPAS